MFKFDTKGKNGESSVELLETLDEAVKVIPELISNVKVADNYCVIALCYRKRLADMIIAGKQNKKEDVTVSVVPILASTGNTSSEFIKSLPVGSKVIVAPSQLAVGHHVAAPKNKYTLNALLQAVEGDSTAYPRAAQDNRPCYFLQFKIVMACDIVGAYED